ncbi:MAG: hypothetical protein ACI8UO_006552 [Verrucomicrobiales bacterium]|jgi:hypothetical protein
MPFRSAARKAASETRKRALRKKITVTLTLPEYLDFLEYVYGDRRAVSRTIVGLAKAKLADAPFVSEEERNLLHQFTRQLRAIGNLVNQWTHIFHLNARQATALETKQFLVRQEYLHHQLRILEERLGKGSPL